jgi:hypothetical protein
LVDLSSFRDLRLTSATTDVNDTEKQLKRDAVRLMRERGEHVSDEDIDDDHEVRHICPILFFYINV